MKILSFSAIPDTAMIKPCPVCNKAGRRVGTETVRHLVQSQLVDTITEEGYGLCMTRSCDVSYYSLVSAKTIDKSLLTIPLWYKGGAAPRYACYCSKVTMEQVRDAVLIEGARSVKDVAGLTGAMRKCNCIHNNPLGKCCHKIIQETIHEFAEL